MQKRSVRRKLPGLGQFKGSETHMCLGKRLDCMERHGEKGLRRSKVGTSTHRIAKSERSILREESPKGETRAKEKHQTETARLGPISGQMVTPFNLLELTC